MPVNSYPRHIRDIEELKPTELPLLQKLNEVKEGLLSKHCADVVRSAIHSGYHRGRRPLIGNIFYPDIISIHHLHLHVIVQPRRILKFSKYPFWLPLMWKSDKAVMEEVQREEDRRDLASSAEMRDEDGVAGGSIAAL